MGISLDRAAYPSDEESALDAPYLALLGKSSSQRDLRKLFNGLRYIVKTGDSVAVGFVDQGYTGPKPAAEAQAHAIALEVVRAPEAKRGFVLLRDNTCRPSPRRLPLSHAQASRTTNDEFITRSRRQGEYNA